MSNELPEGWAHVALGQVADVKLGKMLDRAKRTKGTSLPYLRNANVRWFNFALEDLSEMPFESVELERFELKMGDLLICEGGEPGRCAIWPGDERQIMFQKALLRARSGGALDNRWAMFSLKQAALSGELEGYFTGSTIKHFPREAVLRFVLPLPPLAEQRRIVEKIEALLGQVSGVRERLAMVPHVLRRFRQSILAAACSGRLTEEWRSTRSDRSLVAENWRGPPTNDLDDYAEHLEAHEFPATWTRCRVDGLVAIQNGRAFPSKEYVENSGIHLLRPGNLHVGGRVLWTRDNTVGLPYSWADEFPEFVLGTGELVMNLTAQSLKDEFLGRVCIKEDAEPAILNQRIARFKTLGQFDIRPYLFLYFKSKFFRSFVTGLDTGSLIRHMHSKDVARHVVPLPPPEEQQEIVRLVRSLWSIADRIEHRLSEAAARTDKIPQSILASAFRGELVPTEAELALAEGRDYESAASLLERVRGTDDRLSKPATKGPRRKSARVPAGDAA